MLNIQTSNIVITKLGDEVLGTKDWNVLNNGRIVNYINLALFNKKLK